MTATEQARRKATATNTIPATTKPLAAAAPPPEQQENLPCPRCDSTNTKFCYYNNYNFSQPRHFCKSCRRYWTHGGTLRDIPVGGATRKNAKRSRTTNTTATTTSAVISDQHMNNTATLPTTPLFLPIAGNEVPCLYFKSDEDVKVNGSSGSFTTSASPAMCGGGSFTSLLNTQGTGAGGFWALGGFGLGLGLGPDIGFGPGRVGVWPFAGIAGDNGATAGLGGNSNGGGIAEGGMGNTWQFESGDNGGLVNGGGAADWFSWPDLAISTPGTGLK